MSDTPRIEGFGADASRSMRAQIDAANAAQEETDRQANRDRSQKEHNDKTMLIITATSVFVAIIAAGATVWGGLESHWTRIEDERPYVRVEFSNMATHIFDVPKKSGDDFDSYSESDTPEIKLMAFGRTPAVNVTVLGSCTTNAFDRSPKATDSHAPDFNFIFPGQDEKYACTNLLAFPAPYQKTNQFSGLVRYKDNDNREYQTPFCFVYIVHTAPRISKAIGPPSIERCQPADTIK